MCALKHHFLVQKRCHLNPMYTEAMEKGFHSHKYPTFRCAWKCLHLMHPLIPQNNIGEGKSYILKTNETDRGIQTMLLTDDKKKVDVGQRSLQH